MRSGGAVMRPGEPLPYWPHSIADGALGAGEILETIEENENA